MHFPGLLLNISLLKCERVTLIEKCEIIGIVHHKKSPLPNSNKNSLQSVGNLSKQITQPLLLVHDENSGSVGTKNRYYFEVKIVWLQNCELLHLIWSCHIREWNPSIMSSPLCLIRLPNHPQENAHSLSFGCSLQIDI